ncbi:MAG: ABC transporter permease [Gemmatimonadaceae bacterium]|nr:ABC transporter permease [Gemmatimonadaceae bacterium]
MKRFIGLPSRSSSRISREVDEELAFHLQARTDELVAAGADPDGARAQAVREFGDIGDARRYLSRLDRRSDASRRRRDYWGDLRQDVAYALRTLRRSPGFALSATLTLALGIGANTAIFSVVNGVLLRSLPFPQPDALYQVWTANAQDGRLKGGVSPVDLDDWRTQRRQLQDIGGYWYAAGGSGIDLIGRGEPQRLSAVFTTAGFYGALAVTAEVGRVPREDELVRGGRDRVVMLSHQFWQREFGGDRSVVGRSLTFGRESYEVLGVLPASMAYPAAAVDVYVPYSTIPDDAIPRLRAVRVLDVVARARPGVSRAQVEAELNSIAARLAREYPENASWGATTIVPLHDAITGDVRRGLLLLFGAVAFVLLIACVNVASLLLARASVRGREMAVRRALGAVGGRLVRQMLTESLVLALAGGVAGVVVAFAAMRWLRVSAAGELPLAPNAGLDASVLFFALGLSLLTGLLFGSVPALRTSTVDLQRDLRAGGRGVAGAGASRLRHGLVVAEVALAMMLVVGGSVMTRSFLALLAVDPGFRPDQTLVFNYTLSSERHADYRQAYQQILERVRAIPGVVAAGAMKDAPLRGVGERVGFTLPGQVIPSGQEGPTAASVHVSDGIFRALGTPLLSGREFEPTDRADAPLVLLVNEAFARRWFPGEPARGKRLEFGRGATVEIIGVVGDIRQRTLSEPAEPTIYIHVPQNGRVRMNLIVRTLGDPLAMTGVVREAIRTVDPLQAITDVYTLEQSLHDAVARPRLLMGLMAAFGALGLSLGALGLYGVLAYLVNQRQREIGVRLALGADRRRVLRMVLRQGMLLAAGGVLLGIAGALAVGGLLRGVVYGVNPADPALLALVTVTLLAVAAAASWIPARRAASVDPVVTLRDE